MKECPCCGSNGTNDREDCTGSWGNMLPRYKGKIDPAPIPLDEEDELEFARFIRILDHPIKPAQDVPEDAEMKTLTFKKDGKTITFQSRGAESFTFGGEYGFSAHAKDGSAIPFEVINNDEEK